MFAFTKITLARQFMLASLLILLTGMLIIGYVLGEKIETAVLNQSTIITAMYVDSFVSPQLQNLSKQNTLEEENLIELDHLLSRTSLGRHIVSFKIWSPEGQILYSPNSDLIGKYFSFDDNLEGAFSGNVMSEISDLNKPEHKYESKIWELLIETYAPVRADSSGKVIAVSEFYQLPDNLIAEIKVAQMQSWLVVVFATVLMYFLLTGMVGRASKTILIQQDELRDKVTQLSELLSQNKNLTMRVRRAASRVTLLNEQFLRRISSDLHDGPAQDLAFALLRIDSIVEACGNCPVAISDDRLITDEFKTMHVALGSAMEEVRTISAGLRLPILKMKSPAQVAERVIRDYHQKTNQAVDLKVDDAPKNAPMPVKITLFRVLQEALSNGFRHAGGSEQSVRVWEDSGQLHANVRDAGMGFDPQDINNDGHLGLAGMRERVEVLGGMFSLSSTPGEGTLISMVIPLNVPEVFE